MLAIYILIIAYSCSGVPDFDSSASSFKQAKKSFSDGKYTRAKSEFEYLILNDPLSRYATESYFYIAESKYHLKQYNQAILDYEKYLSIDQSLYRPADVESLISDSSKAKMELNWQNKTSFSKLVELMVRSDYEYFKKIKI